jgi:hypothetical protein
MLPELPRQNNRKESKIDSKVLDWFLENYPEDVLIEVKVGKNKLLPHQVITLQKVADGQFKYKFPDMGMRTPGDGIVLKKAHPFLVVCNGNNCEGFNKKTGEVITFKIK